MRTAAGILMAVAVMASAAAGAEDAVLRVHLPRTITVKSDTITLGRIGVVRSPAEATTAKAEAVAMGRSPWVAEELVIDRNTVLSRLACSGFDAKRVQITGADKVTVTRESRTVAAERIVQCAAALLKERGLAPPGGAWKPTRTPKDLVVAAGADVKLRAEIAKGSSAGAPRVTVAALVSGRRVGSADVLFGPSYQSRQAVATADIAPGQPITPENAKVETIMVPQRPGKSFTAPWGMVAAKPVRRGSVIDTRRLGWPGREFVIRQNQMVLMKINGPGFTVTALGQALQNGRGGELVKVRNVDSKRVITARVAFDGTVEPLFDEVKR